MDGAGGSYRYLPPPRLVSLKRTSGPTTGGTYLNVYGVNFVDTGALACHFGHHPQHTTSASSSPTDTGTDTGGVTVRATWISSHELTCMTPPFHPGAVPVELTLNGHEFTRDRLKFTYHSASRVRSVSPTHGHVHGGTTVRVVATNMAFTGNLACSFGGGPTDASAEGTGGAPSDLTLLSVPATYVSSTELECVTSPHAAVSARHRGASLVQNF